MSPDNSFDALNTEIEHLKSQLTEARKEASRFRSILNAIPDHIMLLDVAGTILDINHTVPDLSRDDVLGTPIFQYMSESFHAEAAACLEKVWSTGEVSSYRTSFPSEDGASLLFETKVALLLEDGRQAGLLAESRDITVLNQAIKNLQKQSEALNRSQLLANIGSWDLELESGQLSWSDQVFRIFGLSSSKFEATYDAFLESIHPDDREMVNEAYTEAVANKTPYDVVHRVLRPDGTVRVVRETSKDFLDESGKVLRSTGIVHDITEQHAIQQKLEENERFLSTLLANVPGAVYRCANTLDWPMEYLSEGCFELTGYHSSQLMLPAKKSFGSLMHPDDREPTWLAVQKAVESKTSFELTYRIQTASGAQRWMWERGRGIFDKSGNLQALEGFITDYSNIKEEQLNRLDLERKIMKNQKLESLGLMAGGIAHDFNNLLTIILGNADLARSDLPGESPIREYLDKIEMASQRAADLALQMLAYSGNSQFVVKVICINDLLREMAQMMEISISRAGILKLDLGEGIPGFKGDETQVRQIVMNLISNAAESDEVHSGTITVASGHMWCDRQYLDEVCATHHMMYEEPLPEGEFIYLEILDTGSGIEPSIIDRIFDPFFTTKFTGRGLGLAATLGIIRGHGGTLLIQTEAGAGTSFRVFFPVASDSATEEFSDTNCCNDSWRAKGLVLLADDEELIRSLGTKMLERMGFDVITAPDGQAAVNEFEKHADEISLVLLDLTMPLLNGAEAFEKIISLRPDARVILCSGFAKNESSLDLKKEGLKGYLHKPFSFAELSQKIKETLD